jgi:hypothetical protein
VSFIVVLNVVMLSVVTLNVVVAECRGAEKMQKNFEFEFKTKS